jgi:hypothetical protein
VAAELGYPVRTLYHAYYGEANNYIFEILPLQKSEKREATNITAMVSLIHAFAINWLYEPLTYLPYFNI